MKYTDDEIIKALNEADGLNEVSLYCADSKGENPSVIKMSDIVDLIKRQKAEIERLNGCVKSEYEIRAIMKDQMFSVVREIVDEQIDTAIKLARKELAEQIKMAFYYEFDEIIPSVMADKIDKLVSENGGNVQ